MPLPGLFGDLGNLISGVINAGAAGNAATTLSNYLNGGMGAIDQRTQQGVQYVANGQAQSIADLSDAEKQSLYNLLQSKGQGLGDLGEALKNSLGSITNGRNSSVNTLTSGKQSAIQAIIGAENGGINQLQFGKSQAMGALTSSRDQSLAALAQQMGVNRSDLDATLGELQPFIQAGQHATQAQSDLLGLGDPTRQASAISGLENGPLYTSLIRQGEQGILANAAATGGLRGGNAEHSLANFRADTLSNVIQNQLQNLSGLSGEGLTATGQASSARLGADQLNTGLANNQSGVWNTYGANVGNLDTSTSQAIQQLMERSGGSIANLDQGTASAIASILTGAGNSMASAYGTYGANQANLLNQNAVETSGLLTGTAANKANVNTAGSSLIAQLLAANGGNEASILSAIGAAQAGGIKGSAQGFGQAVSGGLGILGDIAGAFGLPGASTPNLGQIGMSANTASGGLNNSIPNFI